jgi:hypothetical protein
MYLNYRQGSFFDTDYQSAGLMLSWFPFYELSFDVKCSSGFLAYDRHAFDLVSIDTTYQWMDTGEEQRDRFHEIALDLEIYKWGLLKLGFAYRWSRSNSYGYTYYCPDIHMRWAMGLPWEITLQVYGVLQWKRYEDALEPLLQIRPDSEYEENSFAVIDASRDIFRDCSLRFRMGWYRNESPFRSHYYQKRLVSCGATLRF